MPITSANQPRLRVTTRGSGLKLPQYVDGLAAGGGGGGFTICLGREIPFSQTRAFLCKSSRGRALSTAEDVHRRPVGKEQQEPDEPRYENPSCQLDGALLEHGGQRPGRAVRLATYYQADEDRRY